MTNTTIYTTRDEAIQHEIIDPIEASGEVADARTAYDVDAIADEVLGDHAAGYAPKVDADEFWRIVERHARPADAAWLTGRDARQHPELIGLQEAADRCGVSYRTLRRWIEAGRVNAVRVGPRLLKVSTADLEAVFEPVGGGNVNQHLGK